MTSDIILLDITKKFNDKVVLDHINMTFHKGKTTCIMGTSGVGKTTLLNIVLGLERADSGKVSGTEGKSYAAVFQEDRLCEEFDAVTNVLITAPPKVSIEQIKDEFKKVSLTDYERKPVSNLSGGMKRRVAIVRAVLANADIIILDEPLKGFDFELKSNMTAYLKEELKGKTVLMVTHEKVEADILGDTIIQL